MNSYIINGIRMGPFIRLLRKHGFTLSFKKSIKLLYILQNCLWSSLFAYRQRKVFGETLKKYPIPDDPVIIIGHWRTGSTFLHNLLSHDPHLVVPSLFQVTFPESFLVSERFFRPIMSKMLKHRPMDNMELRFDDPQEDEFALFKLTSESPYIKVIFPEKRGYFFKVQEDFYPSENQKENWKKQFQDYCRKVARDSGKRVLLKNPMHSMRIPLVLETFPNARFIHIHRHPYKVVPSSMHLWKVMAKDNQLKGKPYCPSLEEVTEGLDLFYKVIQNDLEKLPEGSFCEVSYEALEKDPIGEVMKIYSSLGMDFSEEHEKRIMLHLDRVSGFRKNSYTFGDSEKDYVKERLKKHFQQYQYPY